MVSKTKDITVRLNLMEYVLKSETDWMMCKICHEEFSSIKPMMLHLHKKHTDKELGNQVINTDEDYGTEVIEK